MKILVITPEYPPDEHYVIGRWARGLSTALAERGHEAHVLVPRNPSAAPQGNSADGVTVHELPVTVPVRGHIWVADVIQQNVGLLAEGVRALMASEDFDVVHAHGWQGALAASAVKQVGGMPFVLSLHDCERVKAGGQMAADQAYIAEMEAWAGEQADVVLCDSHALKHMLVTEAGLPHEKLHVIPPGVAIEDGPADSNVELFRHHIFAAPDQKLVAFVGRLTPSKRVDVLLEAAQRLLPVYPQVRFAVAGGGPLLDGLRGQVAQRRLERHVIFTEYITGDVLNCLYRAADLVVCPGIHEPSGMVALEAMAHHTPVIASAPGVHAELIEPWRTGVLVPPGEPNALAQAIVRLLYLEDEANTMADNAHEHVAQRFSWMDTAETVARVYERLTSGPQSNASVEPAARPQAKVTSLAAYRAQSESAAGS